MTPRLPGVLFALLAGLTLSSCSAPAGNDETDRIVETVSTAISSPRQESAEGLARAAAATTAGQDGRLAVLRAEDLDAEELVDPLARLLFRVALEGSESGFVTVEPVTACYEVEFSFYGVTGTPNRIGCPPGAEPIELPPAPASPTVVIPEQADAILEELLAGLPATPTPAELEALVTSSMPAPAVNPQTGLVDLPPSAVEAAVDAGDVGVALWDADSRSCLLGARVDGQVAVWRPSRTQMMPGELSCDAHTALGLQGTE